jgi:hypothetical protein
VILGLSRVTRRAKRKRDLPAEFFLPEHEKAIGLGEVGTTQKEGVNNRKDERSAPNREAEHRHNGGVEGRGLAQAAQSESQITPAHFEKVTKSRRAHFFLHLFDPPNFMAAARRASLSP